MYLLREDICNKRPDKLINGDFLAEGYQPSNVLKSTKKMIKSSKKIGERQS